MGVKMPLRMFLTIRGPLMEAHRIRERGLEEIVIPDRQTPEEVGKTLAFRFVESQETGNMTAAQDQGLERPHRPVWYQSNETLVFANNPLSPLQFEIQVGAKQAGAVRSLVLAHGRLFARRKVWHFPVRPNLSVRVRIARAHLDAAILENLHVPDPRDSL